LSYVNITLAKVAHAHVSPAAVSSKRKRIALALAGIADLAQMGFFPIFGEGALSIPDDVLDLAIALVLLLILGFRWRLAAALVLELVPGATLFPTWTAVVMSLPTIPEEERAPALPTSAT
jgi:hypothetical protein